MFSATLQPDRRVRIYRFGRDTYLQHFRDFVRCDSVMAQTFVGDEVTLYKYTDPIDDHLFGSIADQSDPRPYHVINIHEDVPGIDHVGIVHRITSFFVAANIPLLYLNTYAYNLILISEEHFPRALTILRQISNLDET
jgi:hypothetical protein